MANTAELYANNASSTLAGSISNVATALNLASGTGTLFPNPNNANGEFFRLSLTDAATALVREIMYCTARSGDTCTVLRGQEGTAAVAWLAGDIAANMVTAGAMQNLTQAAQTRVNPAVYDATDTGIANSYAIQFTPTLPAGIDGVLIRFKAANANTGASTVTADGGTSYPLTGVGGSALQGGEIVANGICSALFNSSGTPGYTLLSCTGGNPTGKTANTSNQVAVMGQLPGVIGSSVNMKSTLAVSGTSLTFTADQVVAGTAIGGLLYLLSNLNVTVNGAVTGINGLDTGALAINTPYLVYAAYNPVTQVVGAFLTLGTTAGGIVYGGANRPAGFTVTALIGVWVTNPGAATFKVGNIRGRRYNFLSVNILSSNLAPGSPTTFALAAASVPLNATSARLSLSVNNSTANSSQGITVFSDGLGSGAISSSGFVTLGSAITTNGDVDIATPGSLFWSASNGAGNALNNVSASSLTF